jgi:hypothetical protein
LFKTGLIPGQEYRFSLTPEDPGFAEVSTDAEETALEHSGTRNLVRLNDGTLVAVWEADDNNIICAESDDSGTTWASYKGDNQGTNLQFTSVATNGSRIYIVADQTGQGDLQYAYNDGGCPNAGWTMTDITAMTNGFSKPSIEYDGANDEYVMCTAGTNDDEFYAYMPATETDSWTTVEVEDLTGAGGGCGISVGTDGQTWICYDDSSNNALDLWNSSDHFSTSTKKELNPAGVVECDVNARGNTVIVAAEHAVSDDLFIYYSNNSGTNFTESEIDATTIAYPTICLDSKGEGHLLHWLNDANDNIYYRNVTSSGIGTAALAASNDSAVLKYTAPLCHNYPSGNRMTDGHNTSIFSN